MLTTVSQSQNWRLQFLLSSNAQLRNGKGKQHVLTFKVAQSNNFYQCTCMDHFFSGHLWAACNWVWKRDPSHPPSVVYTSLSSLRLLDCGFLSEGRRFPKLSRSKPYSSINYSPRPNIFPRELERAQRMAAICLDWRPALVWKSAGVN